MGSMILASPTVAQPLEKSRLHIIESALASGSVRKLEVFQIRYDILFRFRVTPRFLREHADKTFVVRVPSAAATELRLAIADTRVERFESSSDLRWGVIFYGPSNKELHSVYLDGQYKTGTGRKGYIDGIPVKLNESLISWFEKNFP